MGRSALGEHHPFRSADAKRRYTAYHHSLSESWPLPSEVRFIETGHGRTLVRSSGPDSGAPLVLLPGAWGHSLLWPVPMLEALSAKHRVHAIDNIVDFGGSVSSRPVTKTADFMSWLDGILDVLSPSAPVVLAGLSRGGWLAAEYSLHSPQRLSASVWICPALVVHAVSLSSIPRIPQWLKAIRRPSVATVDTTMRWLMPEWVTHDEQDFQRFVEQAALGLECFDTRIVGRTVGPRVFSTAELRAIEVPVLYLTGQDERMTPAKAAAERLRKAAPHIRVVLMPGAGHAVTAVHPVKVSGEILRFTGELTEPAHPADSAPAR